MNIFFQGLAKIGGIFFKKKTTPEKVDTVNHLTISGVRGTTPVNTEPIPQQPNLIISNYGSSR